MEEKEDEEKEQKLWGTGYFERLIVKIAPQNRPDLQGKIVEGKIDPRRGIAQLREHWDCNAWHMNCRECGDCPLVEHVNRVETENKPKISDIDISAVCAGFGEEGLRNILMKLKFPYNFSGPIYIPLRAEGYICARISEGMVDVTGIDLENSKWLDCHLEIDELFFMTSDRHLEFWIMGLIKKQILIGLIRYARRLMGL